MRALVGVPFAIAVACTPFGLGPSDASAPTPDTESIPSADAADSFATPTSDAPFDHPGERAPSSCFDFTNGDNGFMPHGNATRTDSGFQMTLVSSDTEKTEGWITRTFTHSQNIRKSTATIKASGTFEGTFQSADAYVDVAALYLGAGASYQEAPALELALVDQRLEANIWHATNTFDRTYPLPLAASLQTAGTISLARDWPSGETTIALATASTVLATQRTEASSNIVTVKIGGSADNGTTPRLTLTVSELCLTLE